MLAPGRESPSGPSAKLLAMTDVLYLEDLAVGQKFTSAGKRVDEDEVRGFAKAFDPQPFHLDHEAAANSVFGRLAASGWHTGAMTMRLLVDSHFRLAGGIVGTGFDEFRWLKPVYPDDTLRLETEVVEIKPSKSKPTQGLVKVRITTLNQRMEAVLVLLANLIVPCRP
jgi:acyl dehydratase